MFQIRILVADDHPIFLEGFCTLMGLKYPEIEIVAAVSNGEDAIAREAELDPDVCLLDIRMPHMDGIEAARRIRARRHDAKIVMLTTFNEKHLVLGALRAGAKGYILKETPIEQVVQHIKTVHGGDLLIASKAAETLGWMDEEGDSVIIDPPEAVRQLSKREQTILKLMIEGHDNATIAEAVCLSDGTVRNYVSRVYDVIGVHNRASLVLWAIEHGVGVRD